MRNAKKARAALLSWLFLLPAPTLGALPSSPVEQACLQQVPVAATALHRELLVLRCRLATLELELQQLRGELLERQAAVEASLHRQNGNERSSSRTGRVQAGKGSITPGRYDFSAWQGDGTGAPGVAPEAESAGTYAQAFESLLAGDEDRARRLFRLQLERQPDHPLTSRARFWYAELLLRAGEAAAAEDQLRVLLAGDLPAELLRPVEQRLMRLRAGGGLVESSPATRDRGNPMPADGVE